MNRTSLFVAASLVAIPVGLFGQMTGPATEILIPVAGDIEGANGTHFRSDITIANFRDTDQRVRVWWVPDWDVVPVLVDPGPPVAVDLTIPAHGRLSSEKFIVDHLSWWWKLGALRVAGITAAGETDGAALLQATARIWTPQPGSTGTTSQSFPVFDAGQLKGGGQTIILGQRIDSRFRTNVGVINLAQVTRTFDIYQSTNDPTFAPVVTSVTLSAMSMKQVPLRDMPADDLQIIVVVRGDGSTSTPWLAYASSVDNVTGDSWSNVGLPQ